MASRTVSPPEELPTGRGVYPTLVLPFDEEIQPGHEAAGTSYHWGDVRLPRRQLPVLDGHDGEELGIASHFVLTSAGVWAALKLGHRGEEILRRGPGVSAEIIDGQITHVALVGSYGAPAFASAGVYDRAGTVFVSAAPDLWLGMDAATGTITSRRPAPRPDPSPPVWSVVDIGEERRAVEGFGMAAVDAEVERRRREFERRKVERVEEDLEREETRLVGAGVPTSAWPAHLPGRQRWNALQDQMAAEAVADEGEIAARDFAERMQRLLARAARPWWRFR